MDVGLLTVKLKIQELSVPWNDVRLKGRLYAATPYSPKPRGTSAETWAVNLLRATTQFGVCHLTIPRSFCPSKTEDILKQAGISDVSWIDLMDLFKGYDDFDGHTPIDAVREIVDSLKTGEDVMILSGTKKISGFVPAIITLITTPDVHAVKVWNPITSEGYELTPFQLGYIYGLSDAGSCSGVRYIREQLSIGCEGC